MFILYATTQLILSTASNGSFSWFLSIYYIQYMLSQIEKVLLLSNAFKVIIYYILTLMKSLNVISPDVRIYTWIFPFYQIYFH